MSILLSTKQFIIKNQKTLLTSMCAINCVTAPVLAAKAYAKNPKKDDEDIIKYVKRSWVGYTAPAISVSISIASLLILNKVSVSQTSALMSAWAASNANYEELLKRTKVYVPEDKLEKIDKDITIDKNNEFLFLESENDVMCLDIWTGRKFKSSYNKIKTVQNEINHALLSGSDAFIPLNHFYHELGLSGVQIGDDIGWYPDVPMSLSFEAVMEENRPLLGVMFSTEPGHWRK